MAYSSGFSPHPRISYANAASTGAASEAEYLEIGLALTCEPEAVRQALDEALPPGLDVLAVVPASGPALADRLQASRWQVDLGGVQHEVLVAAVAAFVDASTVEVQRMTRSGPRVFDARAAVASIEATGAGRVDLVIRHGEPLVRPDDVVSALRAVEPGLDLGQPPVLTRLAQGPWRDGRVHDPLA